MAPTSTSAVQVQLGQRVREERERAGLRQRDLAAALELEPSVLSRLELGQRRVDALLLHRIARELGVSVEVFFSNARAAGDSLWVGDTPGQRAMVAAAMELVEERRFWMAEAATRVI